MLPGGTPNELQTSWTRSLSFCGDLHHSPTNDIDAEDTSAENINVMGVLSSDYDDIVKHVHLQHVDFIWCLSLWKVLMMLQHLQYSCCMENEDRHTHTPPPWLHMVSPAATLVTSWIWADSHVKCYRLFPVTGFKQTYIDTHTHKYIK